MRTTKIVATLGPATSSRERVAELIEAGVNVVRLNFSHGEHREHAAHIALVREVAQQAGQPVAVLQDLQGPKLRTGRLTGGEAVQLRAGERFTLTTQAVEGDAERVATSYAELPADVAAGDRILLSDGLIELRVVKARGSEVETEVVTGGLLQERQGIHLPGVEVSAPSLTEKDERDLAFGLEQGVDFVALSFVRRARDVAELKERIARAGSDVPVIAKIEKREAVDAAEEILAVSDGVMVARGDLGVELAPEKVPLVQKRLIEMANERAVPVITATQMLESMIHQPRPTRAEASDVANAILDGSDAVMLSGETAVGKHPIDAVRTMLRIAAELQRDLAQRPRERRRRWSLAPLESSPEAIGAAVGAIVNALPRVDAVWVFTQSGSSARLVAHHRPRVPIVAFTPNEAVYRRLALLWGVVPIQTVVAHDAEALERHVVQVALERGAARPGDTVVITGSHPFHERAPTNFLKIQKIGGGA